MGYINNKMRGFKVDLDFIIDPGPTNEDGLCLGHEVKGLAELRQKSIWGKGLGARRGSSVLGDMESRCCREPGGMKRTT